MPIKTKDCYMHTCSIFICTPRGLTVLCPGGGEHKSHPSGCEGGLEQCLPSSQQTGLGPLEGIKIGGVVN